MCMEICKNPALQSFFDEADQGKTHGALLNALNSFIDKRNYIAHTPNLLSSDAPDAVLKEIDMLSAFSQDLKEELNCIEQGQTIGGNNATNI